MGLNQKIWKYKRENYIVQYIKLNKSQLACYDKIKPLTLSSYKICLLDQTSRLPYIHRVQINVNFLNREKNGVKGN